MSAEASREQLLEYIKKAKVKIKRLERDLDNAHKTADGEMGELRAQLHNANTRCASLANTSQVGDSLSISGIGVGTSDPDPSISASAVAAGDGGRDNADDSLTMTSGWNSFAGFVTNVVNEVGGSVSAGTGSSGADGKPEMNTANTLPDTNTASTSTVQVQQLQNHLIEKDLEIDALKQQYSEKVLESQSHEEVIEVLKEQLAAAEAEAEVAEIIEAAEAIEAVNSSASSSESTFASAFVSADAAAAAANNREQEVSVVPEPEPEPAMETYSREDVDREVAEACSEMTTQHDEALADALAQAELHANEDKANSVQAAVLEACDDMTALQQELQTVNEQLKEKNDEIDSSKVKLVKFNTIVKSKLGEVAALSEQLAAAETAQEDMAKELQSAVEQLTSEKLLVVESQVKMNERAEQVLTFQAEAEKAKATARKAIEKLKDIKRQFSEKAGEVQMLQASLQAEKDKNESLVQEAAIASTGESEKKNPADQVGEEVERIQELEALRVSHISQLKALSESLKSSKADADSAREEREWQRRRVLELEGQLEDSQLIAKEEADAAAIETRNVALTRVQEVQVELDEVRIQNNLSQQQQQQLQHDLDASIEKVQHLTSAKDELSMQWVELTNTHAELVLKLVNSESSASEESQKKEESILALQRSWNEEKAELSNLRDEAEATHKKQIKILEVETSTLCEQLENLTQENESLLSQMAAIKTDGDKGKGAFSLLQEAKATLSDQVNTLTDSISTLRGNEKELASQLTVQKTEIEALTTQLTAAHEKAFSEEANLMAVKEEKNSMADQLLSLQKVSDTSPSPQMVEELEKKIYDLTQQNSAQIDVMNERKSALKALQEEYDVLTSQLSALGSEKCALFEELGVVEKQKETVNEELNSLRLKFTALEDNKVAMTAQLSSLQSASDSTAPQLSALEQEKTQLIAKLSALQESFDEASTQKDAFKDKVLRLKQLLTRSKALTQEKETELSQIRLEIAEEANKMKTDSSISLSEPLPDFKVLFVVGAPVPASKISEKGDKSEDGQEQGQEEWCMVQSQSMTSNDKADSATASVLPPPRWVLVATAREWVQNHDSVMQGAWPDSMQIQLKQTFKAKKVQIERELLTAQEELKEQRTAFEAYKARAQTALKRLGKEEANLRARAVEAEERADEASSNSNGETLAALRLEMANVEQTLENMREEIQGLNKEHSGKLLQLGREVEMAQQQAADFENTSNAVQAELLLSQQRVLSLQSAAAAAAVGATDDVSTSTPPSPSVAQTVELAKVSDIDTYLANIDNTDKEDKAKITEANTTGELTTTTEDTTATVTAAADSSLSLSPVPLARDQTKHEMSDLSPHAQVQVQPIQFNTPQQGNKSNTPAATPHSQGKSMLHQRAEQKLKEQIQALREENVEKVTALRQSREESTLHEEQLILLKDTLREVEATLEREREFNGGNEADENNLNIEYLANIIRKFLLTEVRSERAKLAPILCQILKFPPKEVHSVTAIWKAEMAKAKGPLGFGLLGKAASYF